MEKTSQIPEGNPIINKRIEYFKKRKTVALAKKKDERGGELQFCDEAIARLKRWNRELQEQSQHLRQ